jgi:cytochrome c6
MCWQPFSVKSNQTCNFMKKNTLKFIVISAVLLVVSAIFMAAAGRQVSAFEKQTSGKAIYQKNCARCHGADGKGQGELGKSLDTPDLTQARPSTGRIVGIVKSGEGSMPAFGKKLTAKQISAVANYTKTLR